MIGDLFFGLILHIQPNECQKGDERQGCYQGSKLVASLGDLRDNYYNRRGQKILSRNPKQKASGSLVRCAGVANFGFFFAHEAFAQAVDQSTIALKGCESFGVIQP